MTITLKIGMVKILARVYWPFIPREGELVEYNNKSYKVIKIIHDIDCHEIKIILNEIK